jgi:hypothetical protein
MALFGLWSLIVAGDALFDMWLLTVAGAALTAAVS